MNINPDGKSRSKEANTDFVGRTGNDRMIRFAREVMSEVKRGDENPVEKALKQFGTIASIGGLISLIGTSLGLTLQTIASLTLASIAILYSIVYRQRLDRRVNSGILIACIAAVFGLLVVLRERIANIWLSYTLARATGIVEYTPKANDFLPNLEKLISQTQQEIWFMGLSFYVTLPEYKDQLVARVEGGINVRFLVYDPFARNLEEVASGFSQTPAELESECRVTISNLIAMDAALSQTEGKGSLEVRLFSSVPKARLYMFDRMQETGFTYFIPFVDNRNSPLVPGFLVKNIKQGIAPTYHEGAVALWKVSTPLSDWRKAHPDFDK